MSTSSAVTSLSRRPSLSAVAINAAATLGLILSSVAAVHAQNAEPQAKRWELRFTSGALVATGSQRDVVKDAQLSGAQLSWLVRPSLAVTGSFGWARSRDLASAGAPKLDVFTSDLGVEARPTKLFAGRAVTLTPFAGIGAGARSYNYRKLNVDATHNLAAYGSLGGEMGIGRVGLRLEARDYVTGFRPLAGAGKSGARNDVVVMAALSINRRGASQD